MPNYIQGNKRNQFEPEVPYGEVAERERLRKSAPGAPTPERIQIPNEARPQRAPVVSIPIALPGPSLATPNLTPEQAQALRQAHAWNLIANLPGASNLVRDYAQRAEDRAVRLLGG